MRLFLTREQVIRSMGNRPANTMTLKAGAQKDGTLVALQSKVVGTGGAYSAGGTGLADFLVRELYTCPNVRCENQDVYVNAGPERAFRAPGHPQGAWALEITMDALAAKLGIDPDRAPVEEHPDGQPGAGGTSPTPRPASRSASPTARRRSAGPRRARRSRRPAATSSAASAWRPACGSAAAAVRPRR